MPSHGKRKIVGSESHIRLSVSSKHIVCHNDKMKQCVYNQYTNKGYIMTDALSFDQVVDMCADQDLEITADGLKHAHALFEALFNGARIDEFSIDLPDFGTAENQVMLAHVYLMAVTQVAQTLVNKFAGLPND